MSVLSGRGRELDGRATALLAARAALDKHAEGVVILDLQPLSTVADFFVMCTANNPRQISAIKDHVEAVLAQHGAVVWHAEGVVTSPLVSGGLEQMPQWVLMDCGSVVVHLFDQRTRALYRLEELWADAPRVTLGAVPSE